VIAGTAAHRDFMRPKFPAAFELFYAVFEGSVEDVQRQLDGGDDPNAISIFGSTPIFHAVRYAKDLSKADALIAAGARVELWDHYGMHPLHWIASGSRDDTSCIKWLLDRGVDVNVAVRAATLSQYHPLLWTPLHIAAKDNALPAVEFLLSRGADPNRLAADGATPLHVSVGSHRLYKRLVRKLLDCGADLNAQNVKGQTALHILASSWARYRKGVIQLLRYRRARLDLRDSEGCLPIDVVQAESPVTEELKRLLLP
jgi:ankyrin repeat protein